VKVQLQLSVNSELDRGEGHSRYNRTNGGRKENKRGVEGVKVLVAATDHK
jgi:hypothetical protein